MNEKIVNLKTRMEIANRKLAFQLDEIRGLRDGGWYTIIFGLLIISMVPLFLIEIALLMLFGKDIGIFQSNEPDLEPRIDENEVPQKLRDLLPLAHKWGLGDGNDRRDLLEAASNEELDELRKTVGPRMDDIAQWLNNLSEEEIGMSDTTGLFLYLIDAYEESEIM